MPALNVRQLLFKMAKAGEIYKAGKSRYWLNRQTPITTITPITVDGRYRVIVVTGV